MKKIFLFIFLAYSIFFILFPPFQNPDEPEHYEVVYWVSRGLYPFIPTKSVNEKNTFVGGMWSFFMTQHQFAIPNYDVIKNTKFTPYSKKEENNFSPVSIQAYNPPIYYFVSAFFLIVAKFINANLLQQFYMTRLASGVFYFGTLFFAYAILKQLYKDISIVKGILLFFSLNPVLLQAGVGISPDIAVVFFATLFFYLLLKAKLTKKVVSLLGLVAGAALLTKISAIFLIPLFIFSLYIKKTIRRDFLNYTLLFSFIVVLMQIPWLLFNYIRYHTITVSAVALGVSRGQHLLNNVPRDAFMTILDMRHPLMHFAGFLGWNETFPPPVVFIPYTILFICFLFVGMYGIKKTHSTNKIMFTVSILCLFAFFFIFELDRMLYYNSGWGIGGRNILPIFLPMALCVIEGVSYFFKRKIQHVVPIFYYFAIFYYFYILIFVVIPRYYV